MNPIAQIFRGILLVMLALAGFAMLMIFMVSTVIALGVLYIVARVRGRPFAPAEFWRARRNQMPWQFQNGRWQRPSAASSEAAPGAPSTGDSNRARPSRDPQVIDVEARDLP